MDTTLSERSSKKDHANLYSSVITDNYQRSAAISEFIANRVDRDGFFPGIVFVRHKHHAAKLAHALTCKLGVDVPAITSDTSRAARDVYVERMRNSDSKLPVAVATEVWATGIDIPSLKWVLIAGEGQAPAGLKQKGGRPTRLEDQKESYVIYDVRTRSIGNSRYERQAERRIKHLVAAGFAVDQLRTTSCLLPTDDYEVRWLASLLEKKTPERELIEHERMWFEKQYEQKRSFTPLFNPRDELRALRTTLIPVDKIGLITLLLLMLCLCLKTTCN